MKGPVGLGAVPIVLAFLLLSALPSLAIEHKYIESFNTSQYKDALNTTAWWDTLAGEIKLYPFVPTLVGTCNTPGNAEGVAVSGDHAYVADYGSGLQVIDISDPGTPTLVGTYDTPGNAMGVTVSGDHAFVADGASGLQVINISDPTNPTLVGSYNTPGTAHCVTVWGDRAFVADGASGLQVIDISTPAAPTLAGSCDTPGSAVYVTVSGDNAFVADGAPGLQVIDISTPGAPTLLGSYYTFDARGVAVSGDHAFVADALFGLLVIDISDPTNPVLAGSYDTPLAFGVTVWGDRVFVADYAGLQVIDINDPAHPALVGTYDTPGTARRVTVAGDHAFVADEASGLHVIDIGYPTNPKLAGSYNTPGDAYRVKVSGDHAFVADGDGGLQVIDVSDPTAPTLAGTSNAPGFAYDVAVSGDYAFVADGDGALEVIDISDPTNPTLAGSAGTPSGAQGVTVSGDHAFVADYSGGLQVIDISDPAHPTIVGTYNTPCCAMGVAVSGDYALVAGFFSGLQVIDISDPTHPWLAGSCSMAGNPMDVVVSGDYAFVASYSYGLQVINISDPTNPTWAGSCVAPNEAFGVTVSGDYAFVADWTSGLYVIDISNPASPTVVGTYDTPGYGQGLTVWGDHAFVADGTSGLEVIQVFQSELDVDDNIGRSLAVDASNDTILKARLATTQTDTVTWELSADGGVSWQGIVPSGDWNWLTVPGADLLWRSTHTWSGPGVNPSVTQLEIDWLYEAASTDSIVDVADDQGGWVRMHFARSARDFTDEATLPISNYGIWRRVDNAALVATLATQGSSMTEKSAAVGTPELGAMPVITCGGRTYVQSRLGLATASFPPGTWEWVATVPAVQQNSYIAALPTLADSSASGMNHTVLVLTAHTTTPSIWYVSGPDSGYSVDNIAPPPPSGLMVTYNTGSGNHLEWDPIDDDDFWYFCIYRGTSPGFAQSAPAAETLVGTTTGTEWTDPEYDGWTVYYMVTAVDVSGNESETASPGTVTAATGPVVPERYGLYPNVPNPFNPSTTIRYDVPAGGGDVTLRIYDVSGSLIRTLVDGQEAAGEKTVTWNGRDDHGRGVASGVYFYRLQAPGYEKTLKMTLVQ